MRKTIWILWIVLVMLPGNSMPAAQTKSPETVREDARITKEFQQHVKKYQELENKLEHMLPAVKSSTDEKEILQHQLALRMLVVDARHSARRGDVFTHDISRYFRTAINEVLRSPAAPAVQKTIHDKDPSKPIAVRVNGVFPEDAPIPTMPPTLLMRLPVLPMEFSYRLVEGNLVLQDKKTNLIVDFIPDVHP